MKTRVLIGCLLLAAVVGCGRSAEEQRAEEAAKQIQRGADEMRQGAEAMQQAAGQSADQMAQGLQQMAQGLQQMAQGSGSVKVVDFEALKGFLPEVNGWTRRDSSGEQFSMPAYSRAEATYEKGESRIELEITDTALSQLLLAPMSMFLSSGYSERSDDGFKRAAKVAGQPGLEEWNSTSNRGEVTAVVGKRYIVHATGHDVETLDPVREVAEAVDFGKLAALK
jgi:hypothetical protein